MKPILFTLLTLLTLPTFAQLHCSPAVVFDYDAAGNRISRIPGQCRLEDRDTTAAQNGENFTPPSNLQNININAFPNPTQDYLNMVSDAGFMELPNKKVYVNGIKGELVHQQTITSSNFQLDFSTYAPGYYTVRVIADGFSRKWKIQKM